jgi:hypothetical protein
MTQTQAECEKGWGGKPCRQNPAGTWMISQLAGYKTKDECEKATGKICAFDPQDAYKRWMTTEFFVPGTIGVVPGVTKQPEPVKPVIPDRIIYEQPPVTQPPPVQPPPVQPAPVVTPSPVVAPVVVPPVQSGISWTYIIIGVVLLVLVFALIWYFFVRKKPDMGEITE